MLHHTRISIGSDDVTMLRLQLFFFRTLRLRHIHVKTQYPSTNINLDSYVPFPVPDIAETTQRYYKVCTLCSL